MFHRSQSSEGERAAAGKHDQPYRIRARHATRPTQTGGQEKATNTAAGPDQARHRPKLFTEALWQQLENGTIASPERSH